MTRRRSASLSILSFFLPFLKRASYTAYEATVLIAQRIYEAAGYGTGIARRFARSVKNLPMRDSQSRSSLRLHSASASLPNS